MTKTCFVVGPIGDEGTPTRERADALLEFIVKRVLEAPPFDMAVRRADEIQKPGLITQQVIERVVNADLVVADLTDHNPNAFYELALRHVTRKPVVHMVLRGQEIPFDIAHQRTIYYDTNDLGAAERAKKDLKEHAEAVLKTPEAADNPISAALLVLDLGKSRSSTDQSLARILKEVTELREDLRVVQRAVAPAIDTTRSGPTPGSGLRAATLGLDSDTMKKFYEGLGANLGLGALGARNLNAELLKGIGYGLLSANLKKAAGAADDPGQICANCGQPIAGLASRRSADDAPIHWQGKCPPRPNPPSTAPST